MYFSVTSLSSQNLIHSQRIQILAKFDKNVSQATKMFSKNENTIGVGLHDDCLEDSWSLTGDRGI